MRVATGIVFVSIVACVACGGSDAASPGGTGGAGGIGGAGGVPSAPPVPFSTIYPMIFPNNTNARCNFCHSMPATEKGNGSLHMGGDIQTAYAALVGKPAPSPNCTGWTLVAPGDPDKSLFLQKLSPTPPCGNRMPLGGTPFTDMQLQMIRGWIAAGAMNN